MFIIDNTTLVVLFVLTVFKTKDCAYIAMTITEKFFSRKKCFPEVKKRASTK